METNPIFEKILLYMLGGCEVGPVSVSSERISLVSGVVCCGCALALKAKFEQDHQQTTMNQHLPD